MTKRSTRIRRKAIKYVIAMAVGIFMIAALGSTVSAAPARPARVQLKSVCGVSNKMIRVQWKKLSKNVSRYQIYRKQGSGSWKNIGIVKTGRTIFNDHKVQKGKKYWYKVRAFKVYKNSSGASARRYGSYSAKRRAWALDPDKTPASWLRISDVRSTMLKKVNAKRTSAGRSKLKFSAALNKTAQAKAKDMYRTGVLDHYSPKWGYMDGQLEKARITYVQCGENIACFGYVTVGFDSEYDPESDTIYEVMDGWIHSKDHRTNILKKGYTHIGIGYYKGWWVQQFAQNPKKY